MHGTSINVFFRYDDFSAVSTDTVDVGLIDCFRRHEMCCTFAVIPAVTAGDYRDPTPRETIELVDLKRDLLQTGVRTGAVDAALHGLNHRTNGLGRLHSEFRGLDLDAQTALIRNGKQILERLLDSSILTFVPPWNTYDDATIAALLANGLCCLSANRYGPRSTAAGAMRFLPITAELHELETAVTAARQSGDGDAIIGILMHPYDFHESGDPRARVTLRDLENSLDWLSSQPTIVVRSVSDLAQTDGSLDSVRYHANQPLSFEAVVPSFVRTVSETPYYASGPTAHALKRLRAGITCATYVVAILAGVGLGALLARIISDSPQLLLGIKGALVACLVGLIIRARLRGGMYANGLMALCAASGCLVALLVGGPA